MPDPKAAVRSIPILLVLFCSLAPKARADSTSGTFSVVAYDSVTQELGVAVQSRYFSVGMAVPWAEAGAGAVATQATVNMAFGRQALAMLGSGLSSEETLQALAATDSLWDSRQVGIVDARGRAASWTGKRCLDWAGGRAGPGYACQGNILAGAAVVEGMARAFEGARGELAERLIAALEAGQAAGGDRRGQQSAALLVVRPSATHPEYRERYVDLRVEDHRSPIQELRRLWQIFEGFHGAGRHLEYAAEYDAAGRRELAESERGRVGETLRRALERKETDASLLNGLAWSCATNDIYLDEAREAADRAVRLEPRNIDVLDTLAEVYFRMGNATKAIEVESRAATIDPRSQYLKDQLMRFRGGAK
jgi:uncharacterized Ntn-hydrolase superfamily protein